jgi:hypothetical protein
MATSVEPQISVVTADIPKLVVGADITASGVNDLIALAHKEVSHIHTIEDTNYDGSTIIRDTTTVNSSSTPANVSAGQTISIATVQQMLNTVKNLIDHTHNFDDTYGTNCNCNCNCSRGIL